MISEGKNNNLILKFKQGERAMIRLLDGQVISIKLTHGDSNIRAVFNAPTDVVIDREATFDKKVKEFKHEKGDRAKKSQE